MDDENVQALKSSLAARSRKTVNNVLAVLGKLLRVAVKWKILTKLPCTIELMKVSNTVVKFYEFGQYKRLVEAADRYDVRSLVTVLLGGDAGLRMGEILALPGATSTSGAGRSSFSKQSGKASWTFPRAARAASSR